MTGNRDEIRVKGMGGEEGKSRRMQKC